MGIVGCESHAAILCLHSNLSPSLYAATRRTPVSSYLYPFLTTCSKLGYWKNNFDSMPRALVTLFEQMVVNNWVVVLEGCMVATTGWAFFYFFAYYFWAVLVCMNVLVAFLIDQYQTRNNERNKKKAREEARMQAELSRRPEDDQRARSANNGTKKRGCCRWGKGRSRRRNASRAEAAEPSMPQISWPYDFEVAAMRTDPDAQLLQQQQSVGGVGGGIGVMDSAPLLDLKEWQVRMPLNLFEAMFAEEEEVSWEG